ncbi:hypothetical protein JL722_9387 [Aureococcus anophagefferens]|nr:hypothetical protein JL722_9387 [Aureococcus anophagefferens]
MGEKPEDAAKDLYKILNVARAASEAEIKKAYRKLAMNVLSDKAKKAIYDQHGYEALRDGVPDDQGGMRGGWSYKQNAKEIFENFFGTANPFADFGFGDSVPFAAAAQGAAPDYVDETKALTIAVKPGWKKGTKVTFANEGDAAPNVVPADIVFTLNELPHGTFSREGANLVFVATVDLADALCGTTIEVPTLDGRKLSVSCPEVVSPGYEKTVPGEGMPLSKTPDLGGVVEVVADIVVESEIDLGTGNASGANFSLEVLAYGFALTCGRVNQRIFRAFEGASLAIRGGSLSGCREKEAVYAYQAGSIVLEDVRGFNNSGIDGFVGGVVKVEDADLEIRRCTFDHNVGEYGGAVYAQASTSDVAVVIVDSAIERNVAEWYGGGVYLFNWGWGATLTAVIANTSVSHNAVFDMGGATGGGIFAEGAALTLDNVTVANNSAFYAGGLYLEEAVTVARGLACERNFARSVWGGGYMLGGELNVSRSAVTGNVAAEAGGFGFDTGGGLRASRPRAPAKREITAGLELHRRPEDYV